ncbi:MAG: PepSY domain-containing protein [Steroidobacterales bacterium]
MRADLTTPGMMGLASALLGASVALGVAGLCAASPKAETDSVPAPMQARAEQELSREQAVALVQKRYGARVVRAEFLDQDGRHVFVFRLLSAAGKVWIVRVDARTGTEVP